MRGNNMAPHSSPAALSLISRSKNGLVNINQQLLLAQSLDKYLSCYLPLKLLFYAVDIDANYTQALVAQTESFSKIDPQRAA